VAYPVKLVLARPDCMTFPCVDDCCGSGADVWPDERAAMIAAGVATASDFTEPYVDEDGDHLYRTRLGERGCIFLGAVRGCGLHPSGRKPRACVAVFRGPEEVASMRAHGMSPCHAEWRYQG